MNYFLWPECDDAPEATPAPATTQGPTVAPTTAPTTQPAPTEPATCDLGGEVLQDGEHRGEGCGACVCLNGRIACSGKTD